MSNSMTAGKILTFPNAGFEDGTTGWTIAEGRGRVNVTGEGVPDGGHALHILTTASENGARIDSPRLPCKGPGLLELNVSFRSVTGTSVGVRVLQWDADGNALSHVSGTEFENADGAWHHCRPLLFTELDPGTLFVSLMLIAYPQGDATVDLYVDNFELVRPAERIPPGPSQYKIRPCEHEKLTPADVVGPDGIVYPNWSRVGVQGDIPDVPVKLRLSDLGAKSETDISRLLEDACRDLGAKGGGAILIGEGVFYLDNPVTIRDSGIVIRGSGRDRTRLIFRYSLVQPEARLPSGWPSASVFTFLGTMHEQESFLAADGHRGDTTLRVQSSAGLNPGDRFVLRAPVTPRWQAVVNDRSRGEWGTRTNQYEILSIDGNMLTISDPLRIDFPVADQSSVRLLSTINRCGLEDMTLEHACRMRFDTLTSSWAWDCWARGVDVKDAGCSGVHFRGAKRCTVRDCTFTGFDAAVHVAHRTWWAYAGFTQSADCLMEDCVFHRFRHGPQVQYGAQGNVIRNSRFEGSDMQWHAGWSTENLFENCIVDARGSYGSYGYGAYATGSNDTTHGPNGPRNTVYNCDFISRRDGVFLCGFNENWLFLHNRFDVETGAGFVATFGAFDHIIRHNTFLVRDGESPLLRLKMADCTGIELTDNVLAGGNGNIVEGLAALAAEKGNRVLPLDESPPERPRADPGSIYEWQKEQEAG